MRGAASTGRNVGWMALGTALLGLSGYVFLAVIGHSGVDADAAAALSSLYLLSNVLGPGVFVAVEQVTARTVSAALAAGRHAAVGRLLGASGALAALLTAAMLAALLPSGALRGAPELVTALVLCVAGSAAVFWVRGLASGERRFRRYAATLLVDAGTRIGGCLALYALGARSALPYALALCAGPAVAAISTQVAGPRRGRWRRRACAAAPSPADPDAASVAVLVRSVGSLLLASVLAMALANLAPVLVTAALPSDPALAFAFAAALVLTRAPLLIVGPAQAMLIPRFSAAAALHDLGNLRGLLGRMLMLLVAVGAVGLGVVALAGRPVLRAVFGERADLLSVGVLVLLAAAALVLLAIALVQPALVALERSVWLVSGWLLGAAVFFGAFLLPLEPVVRALVAQVAGPAVTLVVHLSAIWSDRHSV